MKEGADVKVNIRDWITSQNKAGLYLIVRMMIFEFVELKWTYSER